MSMYKIYKQFSDHDVGLDELYSVARQCASLPEEYPFLEIGLRKGGSALVMLEGIRNSNLIRRPFISVDSYSPRHSIPDVDEGMYMDGVFNMTTYMHEYRIPWILFRMDSLDFMRIYPTLNNYDNIQQFALVHIDGEHHPDHVKKEMDFFLPKIMDGGFLVVDDLGEAMALQESYFVGSRMFYSKGKTREELKEICRKHVS